MSAERSAGEIRARFQEDQGHIRKYVEFLLEVTHINDDRVAELQSLLVERGIKPLPHRPYERLGKPYSAEELANLLAQVPACLSEVTIAIKKWERAETDWYQLMSTPTGAGAEHMGLYRHWTLWMLDRVSVDNTEDERQALIAEACTAPQAVPPGLTLQQLKDVITDAVHWAAEIKASSRQGMLTLAQRQLREILLSTRMVSPDAEINLLRQGFLLLMTAFDAAVFDLMRIAFKRKFFLLVGVFGGKDKWSLEEIGETGSFEALRDKIIEEQLKKRYVKDLIGILDALGVGCVDSATSDRLADLIELVLRRNIHVHNRGVVDERYLEADPKTGKTKFNLFGLKLGEVAYINLPYLERADRLCENCVRRFAQWVDAE